jgi:excisionase family DNA binding protein
MLLAKSLHTTATAAGELGVTPCRVRALIASGRLEAIRAGRDWLIEPKALAAVRDRKPGRPPQEPKPNHDHKGVDPHH